MCYGPKENEHLDYELVLEVFDRNGKFLLKEDINTYIYPKEKYATIALYKQPVLALIARSCKTDLPVFILSANNLPDGCGVEHTYHLFELSKESGVIHKELARMGACN